MMRLLPRAGAGWQAVRNSSSGFMLINRRWLLVLAGAVAVGVWAGQPLLTLAGLFGLLVAGAEMLWTRHCLTGVEYERELQASHANWGEEVTLSLRIANRKLLPLTWLQTQDRVPAELPITRAHQARDPSGAPWAYIRCLLPMLPYEQVVRRYTISCRRRGLFEFGPATVESGDLLGYDSRSLDFPACQQLLVYPKLFELQLAAPSSRRIVGAQAVNRVILTDPTRTIGVRGYQSGDPLKHVEWRSSARSRELLVRLFEPTTDPALAIFLNFHVPGYWLPGGSQLEFAISLAASLARWSLEHKCPTGLFGNGALGGAGAVHVPVSANQLQLRHILEVLALASSSHQHIAEVLLGELSALPFEASVLLVTAGLDRQLMLALTDVRRRRPVTICQVKTPGTAALSLPGIDVLPVDYDEAWEEGELLQLAA